MRSHDSFTVDTLTRFFALDVGLRLLHPFMPFITEELSQRLRLRTSDSTACSSISIAPYPTDTSFHLAALERDMEHLLAVAASLRSLKAAYQLTRSQRPAAALRVADSRLRGFLQAMEVEPATPSLNPLTPAHALQADIRTLGVVGEIRWLEPTEAAPRGSVLQLAGGGLEVFMVLEGLVNFAAEANKLRTAVEELRSKLSALQTRMAATTYANVPKPVQSKNREQLQELEQKIAASLQAAEMMEKSAVK